MYGYFRKCILKYILMFLGRNTCHLRVSDSVTHRKVTPTMGFFGQ